MWHRSYLLWPSVVIHSSHIVQCAMRFPRRGVSRRSGEKTCTEARAHGRQRGVLCIYNSRSWYEFLLDTSIPGTIYAIIPSPYQVGADVGRSVIVVNIYLLQQKRNPGAIGCWTLDLVLMIDKQHNPLSLRKSAPSYGDVTVEHFSFFVFSRYLCCSNWDVSGARVL